MPTPSTHLSPSSLKPRELVPLLKETVTGWVRDNAMRLSAALSLYTILSMAPLLVITIKIVGVVLRSKSYAQQQITEQVTSLMGWQVAELLKPMIETGGHHGAGRLATVISTAVLLFSATGVFAELQDSMNTIWGVKAKPAQGIVGFIRTRLLSLGMVFGIGFLLLVSLFVSAVFTTLSRYIAGDVKWLAFVLDVIISTGVVLLLFAAIFKFLPDVKLTWRHVWVGAAITAGSFTIGKYGLALYFKYASPTSAFGAAGSLAAVMLWVYYSSFILFFGAEFTKVWSAHDDAAPAVVPEENAVKITEEDRARKGIPSEKRMGKALAGRPLNSGSRPVNRRAGALDGASTLSLVVRGMAVGLIAGGLGVGYWLDRRYAARRVLASARRPRRVTR